MTYVLFILAFVFGLALGYAVGIYQMHLYEIRREIEQQ